MDNKAGATTKPRRSARTTRQTRKNEDTQVDETDSGTKAANPPRKRRKVAKVDIATAGGEQAIAPKPRRKTGKLSNLLDMPIDILYEVSGAQWAVAVVLLHVLTMVSVSQLIGFQSIGSI